MKKTLKFLVLYGMLVCGVLISTVSAQVISSRNSKYNNVPDYYYANYKFVDDWNAIFEWFTKAKARYSVGQTFSTSEFVELSKHFDKVFPNLTDKYKSIYEKCSLLADSLSKEYSNSTMEALLNNSCYNSLNQAIRKISSNYTVKAVASLNPASGMAPLTVTFSAMGSSDPSMETLPTNNFYRYYRDEKGVDTPIGEGQVLSYTFKESGKFIVHLVVRSSNADEGILDGEKNLTINVTPKAADIVLYANTRRVSNNYPLKISITEGEKGVVFDGSLTKPRGGRKIERHRRTITNSTAGFSYDSRFLEGAPSYINVPLKGKGTFKVTLTTIDNESNTVSENFNVYLSDPVAIIKQNPENGTTSTKFNFDGGASYSIVNRLNTYVWEVFDNNGDSDNGNKIAMQQGKKMALNGNKKLKPGDYLIRLTVTDLNGNQNVESKNVYVESTRPTPQFTAVSTSKWQYPSEFTLDASNTLDIDVDNGYDSLDYKRTFSSNESKIISTEDNNKKIVVQFNERGRHIIRLTVTDQYGKFASVSKYIDIKSTLRPEIEVIPGPITWGKTMEFKSTVNRTVWDYAWDFGDKTASISSQNAVDTKHVYGKRGIYSVKLTVRDQSGDMNTVLEKVFIGEIESPIAAYRVTNSRGYYIQSSDVCRIMDESGNFDKEEAYSVDRYSKISINPTISVNTKGESNGLRYVFEKEAIAGSNMSKTTNQFTTSFSEIGCHYVDLSVIDSNVGKQDKVRIRFNVKNASPTIKNLTLSFPQYEDSNSSVIGFTTDTNSNKSVFDCSGTNNLTIKVTAVEPKDSDGNVSRLRFYYYNIDDPDRILEYKESWLTAPYVYFVIPKIAGEYKFGVIVYDNDGGMIDSEDYLASNPSIYFPAACGDADVPTVTLKVGSTNIQVGDTVTYSVISKISSDNEDFQVDRTFYYDFTGDGTWDLVTKKDTATYTFEEPYEDGVTPRAAVEYRGKLGLAEGASILVKNGIKPILLYNSIGNTVIFRDLSVGIMQEREICFEKSECAAGNKRFKKISISTIDPDQMTGGTETTITEKDRFLQTYDDYGVHKVSIYLKNKYGIEVEKDYDVQTSSNTNNGQIAPGVNMITIPETTFNDKNNPEIFLSKSMKNALVMYINNDSGETCYVDKDISRDSDGDGKTDNDMDVLCNKMVKIVYEPDFESAIGRLYFTNNGQLTFKNYYVTFEGTVLELDDEKREIYRDITTLVNGIEDLSIENTDLKKTLDRLRKNLNNRGEVTALVNTIKDQINDGGLKMDSKQKELLDSILDRLENEDTLVSVGISDYERNKMEILAWLPDEGSIKKTIELMFKEFEEDSDNQEITSNEQEKKANKLQSIRDTIINEGKKNKRAYYNESDFVPYFCNIYDYYDISIYTKKCGADAQIITENYDKSKTEEVSSSGGGLPIWLKIVLIVLIGGLLTMGGIIVFFSIKARMNSASENDEEEG